MSSHCKYPWIAGVRLYIAIIVVLLTSCSESLSEITYQDAPVTFELPRGAHRSFTLSFPEGETGVVLVEQFNSDVRLELSAGSDNLATVGNSPARNGLELAVFENTEGRHLSLHVTAAGDSGAQGTVRLTAFSLPNRSKADEIRLRGLRSMVQGNIASAQGTGAGWANANMAFERAARDLCGLRQWLLCGHALLDSGYLEQLYLFDWDIGAQALRRAISAFSKAGENHLQADAHIILGSLITEVALETKHAGTASSQKYFAEAIGEIRAGIALHERDHREYEAAIGRNYLGIVYQYSGDWSAALGHYKAALEIFSRVDDWPSEAKVLQNIALVEQEQGNFRISAESYDRILQRLHVEDDRHAYADILHSSALAYSVLGNYEVAIRRHEQSLDILAGLGDKSGQARALHGIAVTLIREGAPQRAIPILRESMQLRREAKNSRGLFQSLLILGSQLRLQGMIDEAVNLHTEADKYATTTNDFVQAAIERALDLVVRDQRTEAELVLSAALQRHTPEFLHFRGVALMERGTNRIALGRKELGLSDLRLAVRIHERNGSNVHLVTSLTRLATGLLATGQLQEALPVAERAIRVGEELRAGTYHPDVRASVGAAVRGAYDAQIEALMTVGLSATRPNQNYVERALMWSEAQKQRRLLDLLSGQQSNTVATAGFSQEKRALLYENLATKRYQVNALLERGDPNPEQRLSLQADIALLSTRLNSLEELSLAGLNVSGSGKGLAIADIQAAVASDTNVIEYFVGKRKSWAWLVTRSTIVGYALPKEAEIQESVRELYNLASNPNPNNTEPVWISAHKLRKIILGPVASKLVGVSKLRFALDGPLHYVPLALVLPNEEDRGNVVAQTTVAAIPSLTFVSERKRIAHERSAPRKSIVVIADPVFDQRDARAVGLPTAKNDEKVAVLATDRKWERLPGASREASAIRQQATSDDALILDGFDASLERVLSTNLSEYRVVHFATHAIVDQDESRLSALVLSGIDRQGRRRKELLDVGAIRNLSLNSELVMLNACDSAIGAVLAGEGPNSLSEAFLAAGARNVIAMLWPLADIQALKVTKLFYENALSRKISPDQALMLMQHASVQSSATRASFAWAGAQLFSSE